GRAARQGEDERCSRSRRASRRRARPGRHLGERTLGAPDHRKGYAPTVWPVHVLRCFLLHCTLMAAVPCPVPYISVPEIAFATQAEMLSSRSESMITCGSRTRPFCTEKLTRSFPARCAPVAHRSRARCVEDKRERPSLS